MSKRIPWRALALITLVSLIVVGGMATQYLDTDEMGRTWLNSFWHYDVNRGVYECYQTGVDTMADTPSGARTIWTCGPITAPTNRIYAWVGYDNATVTADSVNIHCRAYQSLDGGSNWFVADSSQYKAKPTVMTYVLDSFDVVPGLPLKFVLNDSLTTLDTTIWDIHLYWFTALVLE